MNNDKKKQELFVKYLKNKYGEENLTDKKVKELKDSGQLQKDYQEFEKALAKKASHGTKLDYFKSLKHQCAEDEEVYYYKKGGSVDCGCKKKGGEMNPEKDCGGGPVAKFKKMRQGGQPKVVNGSTKQPTIQGTAKAQEEFKKKLQEKERQKKIDEQSLKDYESGTYGNSDNPSDSKAMSKGYMKKYEDSLKNTKLGNTVKSKTGKKEDGGKVVAKFKAKCGSKMKKHQLGGSLNEIF